MGVNVEKGKFRARVYHDGKNKSLGMFKTNAEAVAAIEKFKTENAKPVSKAMEFEPMFSEREVHRMTLPSRYDRLKKWLKQKRQ